MFQERRSLARLILQLSYPTTLRLKKQRFSLSLVRLNITSVQTWMVSHAATLERFSFECRKVIGFALSTLRDWLKNTRANFSSNQK